MATKKFRFLINFLIGSLIIILGVFFVGTLILLIFQKISLISLIFLVPIWIVIIIFEREFIWTLFFLLKEAPFKNLSKNSEDHNKILKNYLKTRNIENN
jgi:hypothetical protein